MTEAKLLLSFLSLMGKVFHCLGGKLLEKFGVLRVGLPSDVVGSLSEKPERNEKYKSLYSGLRKLKERKITLHVKHNVKPVIQAARRILFSLRSKVKEKIAELESPDIIECAEGPSGGAEAEVFRNTVVCGHATSK